MPRKKTLFLAVDEDIVKSDSQMKKLIKRRGRGDAFLWLEMLIQFREYPQYDYMVPLDDMDIFCESFFGTTPEHVQDLLVYVMEFGWIKIWKDTEGKEFFYNERRRNDLLNQALTYANKAGGADKTNQKRGIGRYANRDDNRTDNRDDNCTDDCNDY